MIIDNNRFLGGHLVGIGKVRTTGEVEYRELDKPVHNRITSDGLDHLFQFCGSAQPTGRSGDSHGALWTSVITESSSNKKRAGALQFMSYGSGSTATSFSDTDLANGSGSFSSTKFTSSDSSQTLNGTKINSFGNYSFRVTHQSDAAASTTTVNELGWYGAYTTNTSSLTPGAANTTMVLFARVVLPAPITLNAGEYLITTYQLDETNSNLTATTGNDFFGLKDSNGNTLQYEQKLIRYQYGSNEYAKDISEPCVQRSGDMFIPSSSYYCYFPPYYLRGNNYWALSWFSFGYSTSSTKTFPADGSSDTPSLSQFTSTGTAGTNWNGTLEAYTCAGPTFTTKYRDRTYTTGAYNPNMLANPTGYTDIYYLHINGMAYRFGYYDNGTWVPQAWRKYANQSVTFTYRTSYSSGEPQ